MSLGIQLFLKGHPFLMGDLLVSSNEVDGKTALLPTIEKVSDVFPTGSGFVPTSLRQKLCLIDENLAIVWSGSAIHAKATIREIAKRHKNKRFVFKDLLDYFKQVEKDTIQDQASFLGFIRDAHGFGRFFYGSDVHAIQTEEQLPIGLIGSGGTDFAEVIKQRLFEQKTLSGGRPNSKELAIASALHLAGHLLSMEVLTGNSISNYYGGGYEIAHWAGDQFKKFDDFTFIYWIGEINENEIKLNPVLINKYSYLHDSLFVRATRLEPRSPAKSLFSCSKEAYVISPLLADKTEVNENWIIPSLNSKWMCDFFIFKKDNKPDGVFQTINYSNDNSPVVITEQQDATLIGYKKEHLEKILYTAIKSRYPNTRVRLNTEF